MHIDKYPHITNRIEALWGTRECRSFLLDLISDSRDGQRQGLPPEVAREVLMLITSHDEAFPNLDDSQDYVKMTYQFAPREAPPVSANDGVVLRFLVKMSAYGVGLVLLFEVFRRTL